MIESVVTTLAILLGGVWAYFRFVHARVLRPKLTVALSAELIPDGNRCQLRVALRAENRGTPAIQVDKAQTTVALFTAPPKAVHIPKWRKVTAFGVLSQIDLIEPGEQVEEETVLLIPVLPQEPLLVECRIRACRTRLVRKPAVWYASGVVRTTM